MKLFFSTILIVLFLAFCTHSKTSSNSITFPKKEMTVSDTSEGWGGDIILSITGIEKQNSGKEILTVISTYKGSDVGFQMELTPLKNDKEGFHETGILIKSLGERSDKLLESLAKIYGIKANSSLKFVDTFSTSYANLDEIAESMGKVEKTEEVKIKLFFGESEDEKDYGELYLNFNKKEGWIELKEKDSEYRPAVINAFKKK